MHVCMYIVITAMEMWWLVIRVFPRVSSGGSGNGLLCKALPSSTFYLKLSYFCWLALLQIHVLSRVLASAKLFFCCTKITCQVTMPSLEWMFYWMLVVCFPFNQEFLILTIVIVLSKVSCVCSCFSDIWWPRG